MSFVVASLNLRSFGTSRLRNPVDAIRVLFRNGTAEQEEERAIQELEKTGLPSPESIAMKMVEFGGASVGRYVARHPDDISEEAIAHAAIQKGSRSALCQLLDHDPEFLKKHPELRQVIEHDLAEGHKGTIGHAGISQN